LPTSVPLGHVCVQYETTDVPDGHFAVGAVLVTVVARLDAACADVAGTAARAANPVRAIKTANNLFLTEPP
jgi:hypothetical protein